MKKVNFGFITLFFIIISCAGNAKSAVSSSSMTLDKAIKEAAERIESRLPVGTKIALLNFNSMSDQFSVYVLDELTANFLDTGNLTVIDRKEIDLIRGELNFQMSGEVSDNSMQELGRMLGAQSIVSGSL
jgi:TolB-like protein